MVTPAAFPTLRACDAAALLRSLVRAVRGGTTFAWCVEHARAGDPLPAAWAACICPGVMLNLLAFVAPMEGSPHWTRAFRAWCRVERKHPGCTGDPCLRCAVAIHGAVPEPPALTELLARGAP